MAAENIWLITGCSVCALKATSLTEQSGLGKEIALAAADRGQLVIATARNVVAIESLARENLKTLDLDVTKPASKIAVEAAGCYGRLPNVLISNAGFVTLGSVEETTDEELRAQFDTNLFGLAEVARQFLPALRNYGPRGWMVTISSMGAWISAPAFSSCARSHEGPADSPRRGEQARGSCLVAQSPHGARAIWHERRRGRAGCGGDRHFRLDRPPTDRTVRACPSYGCGRPVPQPARRHRARAVLTTR